VRKKVYKLSDIEKILTYVPPEFILLLTILSLIILYFVMEYRQNSKIELHTQQQQFIKQNHLNAYVTSVEEQVKKELAKVEAKLKRSVHILKGISIGLNSREQREALVAHVAKMEEESNINFLVFDKDLNILHGQRVARSIRTLIFGDEKGKQHLDITLMYMMSQGDDSSMSWKNDLTKTIQLSYFVTNEQEKIYIGAFSSVDYFKNLTTTAYINAIASGLYNPRGFYFWFYDEEQDKVYNLDNDMVWREGGAMPKDAILYRIEKYDISIGISQSRKNQAHQAVAEIKKEFIDKRNNISLLLVLAAILLLVFTVFFSDFIKTIFGTFNQREERRNRQIKSLKERYELAVIASNDGLWDTNFKTKKTFFSKKWLDMLGYNRADIRSYDDWLSIIHPEDVHRVIEDIRSHTSDKNKEHLICEYRLKKKNGDYIWVLGRGKAFVDKNGKPIRLSMMSMDIDEKKAADKKLKALVEKELAKNERKRRLLIQQNKMAAMGEMIGAIAHQWRQPLNNISLILHFIRDNAKDQTFVAEKMDDFVNRAKIQIEYMSNTIDDFRDFYQPSKEKADFCVSEAIEATLTIMSTQIDKNSIEVSIEGKPLVVNGYENEFKQAILNILSNAKDAFVAKKAQKGTFQGKIDITIVEDTIRIYNNGGFADAEVLERMFEPYFTTKFEDKGTGIGLYMTKMIIENSMGGEIAAKNIDEGVQFTIKGMK
jgi:PAS domain S-box-containing protein